MDVHSDPPSSSDPRPTKAVDEAPQHRKRREVSFAAGGRGNNINPRATAQPPRSDRTASTISIALDAVTSLVDENPAVAKRKAIGIVCVVLQIVLLIVLYLSERSESARMHVRDGYGLFLWLWYCAICATVPDHTSWIRRCAIAMVLVAHAFDRWGVALTAGGDAMQKAPVMPFTQDGDTDFESGDAIFSAIFFVAGLGAYLFGEKFGARLRMEYQEVTTVEGEALSDIVAGVLVQSFLLGPVVLYYCVVQISAQNAINSALVDFCSRVEGAAWVGPLDHQWEGCTEEAIFSRVQPTRSRAEQFASSVGDLRDAYQQQAADSMVRASLEYNIAALTGVELVFFNLSVTVATNIFRRDVHDVLAAQLSHAELLLAVLTFLRVSVVLILIALTSSGEADVGFVVSPSGEGSIIDSMIFFWIGMLAVCITIATWLLVYHSHYGRKRFMQKLERSQSRANSVADVGVGERQEEDGDRVAVS